MNNNNRNNSGCFKPGKSPWNKGLTKETDERVAKYGKSGSITNKGKTSSFKGKNHTEESKEKNRQSNLGRIAWNKGLTKETDERVSKYIKNNSSLFKKGNIPWNKELTKETNEILKLSGEKHSITVKNNPRPNFKGKHHTVESIEKNRATNLKIKNTPEAISKMRAIAKEIASRPEVKERKRELAIERLEDKTCNFGWNGKESYPEKYFREFIESMGAVKGVDFFQNYPVGRYRLDFAYVDEKHYIEIDGGQHLEPERIEHDIKRDAWLQTRGWTGLRIPVKDLYKFLKPLWPIETGATVVAGAGGVL